MYLIEPTQPTLQTQRRGPFAGLWTPGGGAASGLLVVARTKPLAVVLGGRIIERGGQNRHTNGEYTGQAAQGDRGGWQVTLGGLVIMSNMRQKEATRVVGHPDLASGASVQRGDILYVSVAEAVYRETRGEEVEVRLCPTDEDNEALSDLRLRARHRWDSDRLPDGWTRPLPPPTGANRLPCEKSLDTAATSKNGLPENLRELAERIRAKEDE